MTRYEGLESRAREQGCHCSTAWLCYMYAHLGHMVECPMAVADPESVKPVENPKPATDPESATGVTLQPVDSTGKAT